jgi:transposase-like protein
MKNQWVTFSDVAKARKIDKTTVHVWQHKGLKAHKINGIWVTTYEDVDEYVRTHCCVSRTRNGPGNTRKPKTVKTVTPSNVYSEDYGAMSAKEIANALGISKRRVNQLLKTALTKLKTQVITVYGDVDVNHFL